jgi:hypothetical protein
MVVKKKGEKIGYEKAFPSAGLRKASRIRDNALPFSPAVAE